MKRYKVTGMSCAACSSRVLRAVESLNGAEDVNVNLLTGDLTLSGNVSDEEVRRAVTNAGYGIADDEEKTFDEYAMLKRRLILSLIFLAALLIINMAAAKALLSFAIIIINRNFFINGMKGVLNKAPNMDTLVALGSGISFIYSTVLLFLSGYNVNTSGLYFESSAMILTLITIGKLLEARSKEKTLDAVESLNSMVPKKATRINNGEEELIDVSELRIGDMVIVKPGEGIPCDGEVVSGKSAVDESSITGESIPSEKSEGSKVYASTVNKYGVLKCRVTALESETVFSEIIRAVNDANATKAPIARMSDKVAGIFVPAVVLIALITFVAWIIFGEEFSFAITMAVCVLVISCPCALGLATPVAVMVATGVGAKNGIVYRSAEALEMSGRINTVVFDKTGTLTNGTPKVINIFSYDENMLLRYAYSLEKSSSHPLSGAVNLYAKEMGIIPFEANDFIEIPGKGISAVIENEKCFIGNISSAKEIISFNDAMADYILSSSKDGYTMLAVIKGDTPLGILSIADTVKEDSKDAVKTLKNMNINTIMLTGDNKSTAESISEKCSIETIYSEVLPDEKANIIKELMKSRKVAMVGDGINDAPALKVSDIGVAIGGGKDIAALSADVVLLHSSPLETANMILLSRRALKTIKENLFWAFIYNIIGIPLAAGVFYYPLGLSLTPEICALAMSLSSFCVVTNALRINTFKPVKKEKNAMKKVMKIEGMMCTHCEAHVKNALLKLNEITNADVSHEKGTATLELNAEIENSILKNAVEEEGYSVIEIE